MSTPPVALITGASRGIGAATARELARRGYALVLAARSAGPLADLAGELGRRGAPALPIAADLCSAAEVGRLAAATLGVFGRVDVLIHNAGIGGAGPVARMDGAAATATLATNLIAPIELTRLLLPHMLARGSGAIIFISSVAGSLGIPGSSVYSASKFGLRGFAESLRREVARRGVGVTIISPGFIRTALTADLRLPMPGPALVARAGARAIEHPRREVFVPSYYRPLVWAAQALPWLADLALQRPRRR